VIRAPAALASRGAATGTEDGAGPVDTFEPAADGADALDTAGVTPEVGASFGCAQARGASLTLRPPTRFDRLLAPDWVCEVLSPSTGLGANQIAAHVLASAYNLLRIAKLMAA
jgi:hypothetical protein